MREVEGTRPRKKKEASVLIFLVKAFIKAGSSKAASKEP